MKVRGMTKTEGILLLITVASVMTVAIPRYIEQGQQLTSNKKEVVRTNVKSALIIALADTSSFPDVTTLASYVQGEGVKAQDNGVSVGLRGHRFLVPTYKDGQCRAVTTKTTDTVQCIGEIR